MARKKASKVAEPVAPENAVAPQGLGMGGLGDFSEESLLEAVADTEAVKGTATGEDIRDAMGNKVPKLENIVVKHGGVVRYQFPDESLREKFVGVIVAYTYHNSFFGKPFEDREDGERPPCSSNDGVNIVRDAEDPQCEGGCSTCPKNRSGRDPAIRDAAFKLDRKEACNNYLSLAVALPGEDAPFRLRLSNQSFGPWAEYIQRIGTAGRFLPHEVATRFELVNKKGGGGSDFSVVKLSMADKEGRPLPPELREAFAKQALNFKALLQRIAQQDEPDEGGTTAREAASEARAEAKKSEGAPAAL